MDQEVQLVTLAEITLGQLGRGGFQTHVSSGMSSLQASIVEIPDGETETLKRTVIELAVQRGDPITALDGLVLAPAHQYRIGANEIAFHIPIPNFQSSRAFAVCNTYPALKVGARYFKLAEIHEVTSL